MTKEKAARRDVRFVTNSTFDLTWSDRTFEGKRSALVRGRDISASGARLEVVEEIIPATPVYIQSSKYNLAGTAHVRQLAFWTGLSHRRRIRGRDRERRPDVFIRTYRLLRSSADPLQRRAGHDPSGVSDHGRPLSSG